MDRHLLPPGTRRSLGHALLLVTLAVSILGCSHDDDHRGQVRRSGTFTALGTIQGFLGSEATGVSGDGRVVVGASVSRAGLRSAFRWTAAQRFAALGLLPGGSFSNPTSVSDDGSVIVGNADGGSPPGLHAFRWTVDSGLLQLPGLRDSTVCAGNATSGNGSVVVGTCLAPSSEAFRWTAETGPVSLGRFGTGSNATSTASAVSGNGDVIGGAGHPVLTGAILWNAAGVPMIIGALPGDTNGTISALSRDGKVAAGVSLDAAGHERAFRWTASGIVALGTSDSLVGTIATAISGDGSRVVGWGGSASGGPDVAVIWSESGALRAVSDLLSSEGRAASAGWQLTRARGISADGRVIVGEGINPSGGGEGWIVTLAE